VNKIGKNILVACLGNIFYGDDAFGVEVAKGLPRADLPQNVEVKDFGIRGIDLAYAVTEGYELVILVDTVRIGTKPGDIFVMEPKSGYGQGALSHDMTPNRALSFASEIGAQGSQKMMLIGCQPANLEFNSEMSSAVKNAVTKAIAKVLEITKTIGNE
jgi:hydrogenase maturation protease